MRKRPGVGFAGASVGRKEEKPLRWFSVEALVGPVMGIRGEVRLRATSQPIVHREIYQISTERVDLRVQIVCLAPERRYGDEG